MPRRRVLLTGAGGYVSQQLLSAFRERYDLVLIDVNQGSRKNGIIEADLTDPDLSRYRQHFRGVDTIVHAAHRWDEEITTTSTPQWHASSSPGQPNGYYVERANIDMVFHLLKLALEEGIRRIVVTSSNHAADWYESKVHCGKMDMVGPDSYPLSDNFYGWAKACYEHLGFVFASGRFGRPVENVHIRIGAPRPIVGDKLKDDPVAYRRDLGAYISLRDLQQLYIKSIETEDIRNEDGIPFQIFYGISNNTRAFWSIVNARRVIGYSPEDDSERLFAEEIGRFLHKPGRTF